MSEHGTLEAEVEQFRDALADVSPDADETSDEVATLRSAAVDLIRGIESDSDRVQELGLRASRVMGVPVEGETLEELGGFVTDAAALHPHRVSLYALARAVYEDHTAVDSLPVEAAADRALELEGEYATSGENIEETIQQARSAYNDDGRTDFNDPSRAAPSDPGFRIQLSEDPENPGMITTDDEALYTLYVDNTGREPTPQLRVIASFDLLSHFRAGLLADVPEEAQTVPETARLSPTATPSPADGSDPIGGDDPDPTTEPDGDSDSDLFGGETASGTADEGPAGNEDGEDLSIADTSEQLSLEPVESGGSTAVGVFATPTETGVDQLEVAVQRQVESGEWVTLAGQSVSLEAFTREGYEARARVITGESSGSDDGDGGLPDGILPIGGAGVLTAGGYLTYRRLSGEGSGSSAPDDSGDRPG